MVTDSRSIFSSILEEKREEVRSRMYLDYGNQLNDIKCSSIYLIFKEITTNEVPKNLYVGKTKQSTSIRFQQHMSEIKKRLEGKARWDRKYKWMYGILNTGSDLNVVTLNLVPKFVVYDIEIEWIFYLANNGFTLLNDNNNYFTNRGYR